MKTSGSTRRCFPLQLPKPRRPLSFSTKISLIYGILLFVLLTAIVLIFTGWVQRVLKDNITSHMKYVSQQAFININHTLDTISNTATNISIDEQLQRSLTKYPKLSNAANESVQDFFTLVSRSNDLRTKSMYGNSIYDILILEQENRVIAGGEYCRPQNFSWYEEWAASDAFDYWSGEETVFSIEENVFFLVRKIVSMSNSKDILGKVALVIDTKTVGDYLYSLQQEGYEYLLTTEGTQTVLASRGITPALRQNLLTQTEDGMQAFSAERNNYLLCHQTSPQYGWHLYVAIPEKDVYANLSAITTVVLLVTLCGIAVLLLVNYWISKKLTRPIHRLVTTMQEVASGNLDVHIAVDTGDEFDRIGNSFNDMTLRIKELIEKLLDEEKQKQDIRLEALQAKINSHFLYNSLNLIRYKAKEYDADDIREITTALISLLQASVSDSKELISIESEISYAMQYMTIQQYHTGRKVPCILDVQESVLSYAIPKLILQPLIENIFFHAFTEAVEKDEIRIIVRDQDGRIFFSITDNGAGADVEQIQRMLNDNSSPTTRQRHIGIGNVQQRLVLWFGSEAKLQYLNEPEGGTTVSFSIPKRDPRIQEGGL